MTDAFHGTPITPNEVLTMLGRRNYCVSFYRPDQIEMLVRLAIKLMIDNGAFSAWKQNIARAKKGLPPIIFNRDYWARFYEFVRLWLRPETDWFVIPDVIDAGTQEQDALIRECPADLLKFGAPVWHMDEPISRLLRLIDQHGRVCIGSTAEFIVVGSPIWRLRMDDVWDEITATFGPVPPDVHMLRGMQCLLPSFDYPFAKVDSTDIGRNHNRLKRYGERRGWATIQKANRWDAMNCPTSWTPRGQRQRPLFAA